MHAIVRGFLAELEAEHGVQVRFACESGSRAWGFPSPDSDYDIRFVYQYPRLRYLSVSESRDTIQIAPDPGSLHDLDGSGWDLRKFLRLMHASNASVFEWLQSPIVYFEDAEFTTQLRRLTTEYFQPRRVIHHYLGIATGVLRREFQGPAVKIKKYFYVLRPVLCARWIACHKTVPPVDFYELLPLLESLSDITNCLQDLLQQKQSAMEADQVDRVPLLDNFVTATMQECDAAARLMAFSTPRWDSIDRFYRRILNVPE